MRIGANIPSLQTYNSISKASKGLALSNLRSSSGSRINSAADDAAGLAIATKMRQQVKGLAQASKNSSNAASMIQTAEGALNEVHNMLQRIRELAVQAANDTNELEDRQKMQDEIDSLVQEINDISQKTEYNKIKLLSGECDRIMRTTVPAGSGGMDILRVSDSTPYGDLVFQVTDAGSVAEYTVTGLTAALNLTDPALTDPALTGQTITVTITDTSVSPPTSASYTAGPISATDDQGSILTLINQALTAGGAGYTATSPEEGDGILGGITADPPNVGATDGFTISITTGDEYLDWMAGLTGISTPGTATTDPVYTATTSYKDPLFNLIGQTFAINGELVTIESTDDQASLRAKIIAAAEKAGLDTLVSATGFNIVDGFATRDIGSGQAIEVTGADFVLERLGLTPVPDPVTGGAFTPGRDVEIAVGAATNIFTVGMTYTAQGARVTFTDRNNAEVCLDLKNPIVTGQNYELVTKLGPLVIQVGANKDMGMYMTIPKIDAKTIEIDTADVTTVENATKAIDIADKAIAIVSSLRSRLGAYQNRLDHTVTSLDNSYVNASESLSRIADTDMAMEMTEYAKFNVIYQAGIALLAQSNARPQQVLQLLQ